MTSRALPALSSYFISANDIRVPGAEMSHRCFAVVPLWFQLARIEAMQDEQRQQRLLEITLRYLAGVVVRRRRLGFVISMVHFGSNSAHFTRIEARSAYSPPFGITRSYVVVHRRAHVPGLAVNQDVARCSQAGSILTCFLTKRR